MGSIIASMVQGKKPKSEVDRRDDSREENGDESADDDVRYDGPLDLDRIVLLHCGH